MKGKIILTLLLLTIAVLAIMPQVLAKPSYLRSFETTYPGSAGSQIDTCSLCHFNPEGGGNRNPYGIDFAKNGYSFAATEQSDSDGDEYTNLAEINAGTFPGNANDHPVPTSSAKTPGFSASIALIAVLTLIVYRIKRENG